MPLENSIWNFMATLFIFHRSGHVEEVLIAILNCKTFSKPVTSRRKLHETPSHQQWRHGKLTYWKLRAVKFLLARIPEEFSFSSIEFSACLFYGNFCWFLQIFRTFFLSAFDKSIEQTFSEWKKVESRERESKGGGRFVIWLLIPSDG